MKNSFLKVYLRKQSHFRLLLLASCFVNEEAWRLVVNVELNKQTGPTILLFDEILYVQ